MRTYHRGHGSSHNLVVSYTCALYFPGPPGAQTCVSTSTREVVVKQIETINLRVRRKKRKRTGCLLRTGTTDIENRSPLPCPFSFVFTVDRPGSLHAHFDRLVRVGRRGPTQISREREGNRTRGRGDGPLSSVSRSVNGGDKLRPRPCPSPETNLIYEK